MNAYEKWLAAVTPEQLEKLSHFHCAWCSQPAHFGTCGAHGGGKACSPESRVKKAKVVAGIQEFPS